MRVYAAGGRQLRSFVPTACLGESGFASLEVWSAHGMAPDAQMAGSVTWFQSNG